MIDIADSSNEATKEAGSGGMNTAMKRLLELKTLKTPQEMHMSLSGC
jgi:hypothetical protein